jgi:hypothetical protein
MDAGVIIWIVLITAGFMLFYSYARAGIFFRCFWPGAFGGLASLGALWIAGHFFEIALKVTPLTVAASAIFGVPGVIGMLVLPVIF